ncbi:hypothetical protein AC1031_021560 [Aphanomyces cochlioides]|nr:hypothetical protein AC1031_021560 [Aphanomyces cochlioides]
MEDPAAVSSRGMEAALAPHARGMVRVLLQLEGLAILIACLVAYNYLQGNWWIFVGGFFAGDLLSVGYAFGPALGCMVYNVSHTFVGPTLLLTTYLLLPDHVWILHATVIWASHLGWERSLGYGLRYPDGFTSTHITVDQDPIEYIQNLLKKPDEATTSLAAEPTTQDYKSISANVSSA